MLLLSLLVETGQLPGAGLTQADNTCIQLNFYLEILKGGNWVSRGGKSPPLNATLVQHTLIQSADLRIISRGLLECDFLLLSSVNWSAAH